MALISMPHGVRGRANKDTWLPLLLLTTLLLRAAPPLSCPYLILDIGVFHDFSLSWKLQVHIFTPSLWEKKRWKEFSEVRGHEDFSVQCVITPRDPS